MKWQPVYLIKGYGGFFFWLFSQRSAAPHGARNRVRDAACCRLLGGSKASQISSLPSSLGGRLCNQSGLHVKTHLCTSRHAGYCQSGQTVLLVPARKVVFCPAEKKTSFSLCALEFASSDSDLISSISIL